MTKLEDLAERVDRLLLRHQELKRTSRLIEQQLQSVSANATACGRASARRGRASTPCSSGCPPRARQEARPPRQRSKPPPGGAHLETARGLDPRPGLRAGLPEGGETLLAAAVASVDQEMSAIRSAGKVKARERIAVLAALNLAYQLAERGAAPRAPARRQRWPRPNSTP